MAEKRVRVNSSPDIRILVPEGKTSRPAPRRKWPWVVALLVVAGVAVARYVIRH
jgi:hypothetical protein